MTATMTRTAGSARVEDFSEAEIHRRRLEIREGVPLEMSPAGSEHNKIALRFALEFERFCEDRPDLECCGDNDGFIVRRDPDTFLCPDAALYRTRARTPGPWHAEAPEIVVEVISPDDARKELLRKRDLYFEGGAEQVWIVDPPRGRFEAHFPDGRVLAADGGTIEMQGLALGMRLDLARLLAPPRYRG